MRLRFILNGAPAEVDARTDEMLLGVLRGCGLKSVRETCGIGVCGACTVLMDGNLVSSCIVFAPLAEGAEITTVDALGGDHPVQRAFEETHAFQCGYCTPGMILTAKDLLEDIPEPSEEEIRVVLGGNLCRCGCYLKIVEAVKIAGERKTGAAPITADRSAP